MRSRIAPMKKIARSLRQHRELILNYFRAQKLLSSGVVEGLTNYRLKPVDSFATESRSAAEAA